MNPGVEMLFRVAFSGSQDTGEDQGERHLGTGRGDSARGLGLEGHFPTGLLPRQRQPKGCLFHT